MSKVAELKVTPKAPKKKAASKKRDPMIGARVKPEIREAYHQVCERENTSIQNDIAGFIDERVNGNALAKANRTADAGQLEVIEKAAKMVNKPVDVFILEAALEVAQREANPLLKKALKNRSIVVPGSAAVRVNDAIDRVMAHNEQATEWFDKIAIVATVFSGARSPKKPFAVGTNYNSTITAIKHRAEEIDAHHEKMGIAEPTLHNRRAAVAKGNQ